MKAIEKILVPIDFGETSLHALDYAIDLAKSLGASIIVMHAYEIPVVGFPDGALITSADVAGKLSSAADSALKSAIEARAGRGVKLETVLRQGIAWEEINEVAQGSGVDLVVIGTHGRRGIARALLGSVAEKVVRTSTKPVLTVHGLAGV
jgi:nucleotide-binding universal stress UspA family protein